jgi:hypothetical protein
MMQCRGLGVEVCHREIGMIGAFRGLRSERSL